MNLRKTDLFFVAILVLVTPIAFALFGSALDRYPFSGSFLVSLRLVPS
jgi:hypothetical protein